MDKGFFLPSEWEKYMKKDHHYISIDYYAYQSGMTHWNASCKAAFAVAVLFLVIALDNPIVCILTFCYMTYMSLAVGKTRIRDYLHLLTVPAVFILIGALTILFQFGSGRDSIWKIPFFSIYMYVTSESLSLAVHVIMKAFSAVTALYMLTLSTPMGEIISVFRRIHVPPVILELMYLIYRYIFILTEIHQKQKDASISRLGYNGFATSLRTFGSEMANMLILSMKKAEIYYDSMEARGYDGTVLFLEETEPVCARQIGYVIFYVFLLIGVLTVQKFGYV